MSDPCVHLEKTYATMRRTVMGSTAAAAADADTLVWLLLGFMVDDAGIVLLAPGGLTTASGTTQWLATASSKSSPEVVEVVVVRWAWLVRIRHGVVVVQFVSTASSFRHVLSNPQTVALLTAFLLCRFCDPFLWSAR